MRVHAVEPGPQLVEVLSDRLSGEALSSVECAFFEEVTIDETFDFIWSANAFHWVDPAVAYHRARDLLAPGGSLVLDDPSARVAEIRSALHGWGVTSVAFNHRGYGLVGRRVER